MTTPAIAPPLRPFLWFELDLLIEESAVATADVLSITEVVVTNIVSWCSPEVLTMVFVTILVISSNEVIIDTPDDALVVVFGADDVLLDEELDIEVEEGKVILLLDEVLSVDDDIVVDSEEEVDEEVIEVVSGAEEEVEEEVEEEAEEVVGGIEEEVEVVVVGTEEEVEIVVIGVEDVVVKLVVCLYVVELFAFDDDLSVAEDVTLDVLERVVEVI